MFAVDRSGETAAKILGGTRGALVVDGYTRLRVIALARHNYLFFGHPRAGRNFAGLYSLVGSCVANGVEPTEYLTDVLPRIRDATTDERLDVLLPDRWAPSSP